MSNGTISKIMSAFFIAYFLSHIPPTLLIDGQLVFPDLYPKILKDVFKYYIDTFGDPLMAKGPVWFRSLIWLELVIQLPLFVICSYGLWRKTSWSRMACILYSAHVCTAMVPVLSELTAHVLNGGKPTLIAFYAPFLVIPLLLLVTMLRDQPVKAGKTKTK